MKNLSGFVKILTILTLSIFLCACSMFSGRETAGQYVDDTSITTKVKADILGDPALKVLQVNVETMQGIVQLSGFVDTEKSREKALAIARQVPGVMSVRDSLVVR